MSRIYRSTLALQEMARHRWSALGAFLGVAVAILLMLMQLGFRDALLSSAVRTHGTLAGELVVASPQLETIEYPTWVPAWALDAARGHPQVTSVRPLTVASLPIRRIEGGEIRNIRVVGLDPALPALSGPPGLAEGLATLAVPNRALFDGLSRATYGPIRERLERGEVVRLRLALPSAAQEPELDVAGLIALGPSLTSDGSLVVGDQTLEAAAGLPANRPTLGSVLLRPGADPQRVADEIAAVLGTAARVYTREQFMEREKDFWSRATPIGFIFDTGLVVGGLIGIVFVYQILHGKIARNLPDYAVLKSMGYPDRFFALVVLETAAIIGVVAFGPAVAAAGLLYFVIGSATGLAMTLRLGDTLLVFAVVMVMSATAGLLALRKLREADPVSLFT